MYSTLKVFIISAFLIGVMYLLLEIYKHRYTQQTQKTIPSVSSHENPSHVYEKKQVLSEDKKDSIDVYVNELSNQIREEAEELSYDSIKKETLLSQLTSINQVSASDEAVMNKLI